MGEAYYRPFCKGTEEGSTQCFACQGEGVAGLYEAVQVWVGLSLVITAAHALGALYGIENSRLQNV